MMDKIKKEKMIEKKIRIVHETKSSKLIKTSTVLSTRDELFSMIKRSNYWVINLDSEVSSACSQSVVVTFSTHRCKGNPSHG